MGIIFSYFKKCISIDVEELEDQNKKSMFTYGSNKRALMIGINYIGSTSQLNGCINDVINLREFLLTNLYFSNNDMMIMRDDYSSESLLYPSCYNIKTQINLLVEWANNNPKSEIWLSYSGHGSNVFDFSGDEDDNRDEVLCSVDNKYIKDDWLKSELIDKINDDVSLFILIDACHSGTMCDLSKCNKKIIMISGCKDDQTSADAFIREENEYRGALTNHFLNTYDIDATINEQHHNIIKDMNNKYTQTSVLTVAQDVLKDYSL